jgi:hypothetical protein
LRQCFPSAGQKTQAAPLVPQKISVSLSGAQMWLPAAETQKFVPSHAPDPPAPEGPHAPWLHAAAPQLLQAWARVPQADAAVPG